MSLHAELADEALTSLARRPEYPYHVAMCSGSLADGSVWYASDRAHADWLLTSARQRGEMACIAHGGVIIASTTSGLPHDADGVVIEPPSAALPPAPVRHQREDAMQIVQRVVGILACTCERVEIAGSIRRGVPTVKDAEIVAIAGPHTLRSMDQQISAGAWTKALYGDRLLPRWGAKYRGFDVDGLRVEVFFTDADSWGLTYWLRTGPGDANQALMGRLARTPIRVQDGAVWYAPRWAYDEGRKRWLADERQRLAIRTEDDWFTLLGLDYVEPERRDAVLYDWITVDLDLIPTLLCAPEFAPTANTARPAAQPTLL